MLVHYRDEEAMRSPMQYEGGVLRLIDQRLLPSEARWLTFTELETVAQAIENMIVRGAPAIGCTAAFGLAVDAWAADPRSTWDSYSPRFEQAVLRLARTRPTAVNLFFALDRVKALASGFSQGLLMEQVRTEIETLAIALHKGDLETCKAIGRNGAAHVGGRSLRVLTHCNAGALATAGYGTALGVIRALHERGQIEIVYVDETRPWLQGARLTAFELASENIPYKVIADSAAAYLMQLSKIDMIVVGADRIAANGDAANKIGTYSLAVNAAHHGVDFYVAAPLSTFDMMLEGGHMIPVEERHGDEIRLTAGRYMTPREAAVWNPSFDVTPASLISGIITERGVLTKPFDRTIVSLFQ
jgi:methylthioribose-1-phosphate isomerase